MVEALSTTLNGICPYFTMFPLSFPLNVLCGRARPGEWVLDPFCGRGTTNYAARLVGLPSFGIDSSPVAAALAQAKLANTTPTDIKQAAQDVLTEVPIPMQVPVGEFWDWAFHPHVLTKLCRLREGLLHDCSTDPRIALRAIVLGALHGPVNKRHRTYFSNQCTRTFAPKPGYALRFWQSRDLRPPQVDVMEIIQERARRYYGPEQPTAEGVAVLADSRYQAAFSRLRDVAQVSWVLTSPPYYGMRSYVPDQWLRYWFLGGPTSVCYTSEGQIKHTGLQTFTDELQQVWHHVGSVCRPGARLVARYGGIHDRMVVPLDIILNSLRGAGWRVQTHKSAGTAANGRRQAMHFATTQRGPIEERDVWAVWEGD